MEMTLKWRSVSELVFSNHLEISLLRALMTNGPQTANNKLQIEELFVLLFVIIVMYLFLKSVNFLTLMWLGLNKKVCQYKHTKNCNISNKNGVPHGFNP